MENSKPWETDPRLTPDVIPIHYDLLLHPYMDKGTFSGRSNTTIKVSSPRNFIILHSFELNIDSVTLKALTSNEQLKIKEYFLFIKNQYLVILLENEIPIGNYDLNISFNGSLLNKIIGFYRSSYKDVVTNEKRFITTSKFEPTYARQAFPCFDEPHLKAEFTVQLVKPSVNKYFALSNMNQVSEKYESPSTGFTTVQFAKSVPMSTYLVCFIVCDFDHLGPIKSKQGFPITVYARPGQAKNMDYALTLAVKTIDFYIDYFEIEYPLPKLDLIAIPDFVSGAMEHWGLVTFRETSVLFTEGVTSTVNKKNLSYTITHELAHMWFGNLVTMQWWNDLWLNEGFASFIQVKGVDKYHPDWDVDTQQLYENIHYVMGLDSVLSSHPIIQKVSHPDQITEIFDVISYSKGATVIRMLENMIGPEAFRKGVSKYLKKFAFKNAITEHLWNHLKDEADGLNISQIMDTWTRQMGFPLVSVERSGSSLTITQQRYLANSATKYDESESPFNYKWDIQLSYVSSTNNDEVKRIWLYHDQPSVTITLPEKTTWVKLNHRQFGYYKVMYSTEDWIQLENMLIQDNTVIHPADRANLIDDAFSLALAGYMSFKTAFVIIKYLPKEKHFVPWTVVFDKLTYLQSLLYDTPVYYKFREYIFKILDPVIKDVLWDNSPGDSYNDRQLKNIILRLGCTLEIPSCVNKTKEIFTYWLLKNGPKPIAELRNMIYTTAMGVCGEHEWQKIWNLFSLEEEPQEKVTLRNCLASVHEPQLLKKLIELAKDENNVRSQDFIILLASISRNFYGNPIVWNFVREQWPYLVDRFTLNDRSLGRLLPVVTAFYGTENKLNELKSFIDANPEAGAGASGRKISVEKVQNNIEFLKKRLPELEEIF